MTGSGPRLVVERPGPLTTVQDRGRPGYAHLGVPRSGALDAPAAALANRLVGNPPDAAVLEITLGRLAARLERHPRWAALTGAAGPVTVDGRPVAHGEAFLWAPGRLTIDPPPAGVRSYLAVAGGIDVPPALGSRSTDLLAGLGPAPLEAGDELPLTDDWGEPVALDVPPYRSAGGLRLHPGPRPEWFPPDALERLCGSAWTVLPASNRVGLRLAGEPVPRVEGELPSEGMVLGAVQVPPDGQPVVFLNDHPTTGGYPVIGVVDRADLWQCAQLRPGERVSFRRVTRA